GAHLERHRGAPADRGGLPGLPAAHPPGRHLHRWHDPAAGPPLGAAAPPGVSRRRARHPPLPDGAEARSPGRGGVCGGVRRPHAAPTLVPRPLPGAGLAGHPPLRGAAPVPSRVGSGYLPATMPSRSTLLDDRAIARALTRMASELVERCHGTADVVLIGIQRRGVELAQRLARLVEAQEGKALPCGKLDITL